MMRLLRAMVWLRWKLLVGSMRGGSRRDTLEQLSRALALIVPLAFAALTAGSIVAVSVMGFVGGRAIARGPFEPEVVVFVVRVALALLLALVVLIALASPAQTVLSRYNRLLLLPIPRQMLHAVEVAANLFDPWIAFVIPGMVAMAVGLVAGGLPLPALVALLAAAGMIALLASMSALFGSLVGWLMRSRRRGEMFTLVFVLAISLLSFIPAAVAGSLDERQDERSRTGRRRGISVEQIDASLPVWTRALPSELYGRAMLHAVEGRAGLAALALVALASEAALLFVASAAMHRRMLSALEGDASRRRGTSARAARRRLPLVSAEISAIALAQLRNGLRTVRGRTIVLLPGPLLAILALLFRSLPDEDRWMAAFTAEGPLLLSAGIVFSLYAMQAFTMNLFGSDRHGLARHFLSPVSDVDLAAGKLTGCALLFLATVGLCLAASLAVSPNGSIFMWLAALAGGFATFFVLSPAFVWLSALFPVASDLSKTGPGGNPHPLPMFGGTFLTLLAALPAALILVAYAIRQINEQAVFALMLAWLALAATMAMPLVRLASRTIDVRRENLAVVAAGR